MATAQQLLGIAARGTESGATDGDLLRRYAVERDEAAFAELVRRNGPIVLRACRHVLQETTAAEDAFQATFLLLVREAKRLTRPASLAGWLHAAAVRVARGARRADARARRRESAHRPAPPQIAPDDLSWREVREILDAELAALPEKYRVPLVLCYVQELSYEEAARRAGCPVGALRGRLERGKEQLRKRLARYGLPMAAPALVAGGTPPVSAAQVGTVVEAVRSAAGGAVPPALANLIPPTGRFRTALLLAPVVAALVAVGVVLAANGSPTADPPKVELPKPANPVAEAIPTKPVDQFGDPLPEGAVARLGTLRLFGVHQPRWAAFSPDGKKIVTLNGYKLSVCDATTGQSLLERTNYYAKRGALGWRADGSGVAIVGLLDGSFFVSAFTDPNEKLPTPPPGPNRPGRVGPDGLEFLAISPDATQFVVVNNPDEKQFTIDVLPATVGQPVAGLKPIKTLGPFAGPCREVRFTPRGVLFLTGSWSEGDWTLSIVDPVKNMIARTVTLPPPAYCVYGYMYSLSADGQYAAVPYKPKTVPSGRRSFTNEHDGTIHVWNLETGKEVGSVPFPKLGYGTGHAFTRDGKALITSGEEPYFRMWDVATGKEIRRPPTLSGPSDGQEAACVAVSPDGKRFATARLDGRLDIWDTATAKPLVQYDTHRDGVDAVVVSPDGRLVATLAQDDTLRVWELETGKPLSVIPAVRVHTSAIIGPKRRLAFTPDGRGLLFANGAELSLVAPLTGKPLDLPGRLRGVKAAVGGFSADGKTLATFVGDTVTVWDWPAGTARHDIPVPLSPRNAFEDGSPKTVWVNSAALSPDGLFLFTNSIRGPKATPYNGGFQNGNDLWDTRTGKQLHRFINPEYPPARFSPDGRELYLGEHTPNSVTAWNPASGTVLRRFVEPERTGQRRPQFGWAVGALAVSPDGRLLATAEHIWSFDGVWVYETASGRPLKKLAGHGDMRDLAFSPDGRRLVTVSSDQTGLVWDVTLPALVSGRVGKPTEKELADAWERLSRSAPGPAYLAIAGFVAAPTDAVTLLKAKLQPAPVPTNEDLDRVTAQLGADEPADREKASKELERYGPNAVAGAKTRLAGADSQEVRDGLTQFLTRYGGANPSPYELRCVRGVAALEAIGTPEAKALLGELARGKADDVLTREATIAHRRASGR